ncbi:MAG TPA: tetratricopeptide repeat protein [Bacteroidia bacterium]|nr:tetratricopeptide repeat protein [Bacteroidia bacterium]
MGIESVNILIQRAQVMRGRNIGQAIALLDDALSIAQKENYKSGTALIIRDKAACAFIQKNYKRALTGYTEALQFFKDLEDIEGQLSCLTEISSIYFKLGEVPSALTNILQTLKLNTDRGDSEGIAHGYNEIGKLHIYLQEYLNAIDYFKKALKIFEGMKNKPEMVNSYFLLGNAYNWMDDFDKALYYLLRAENSLEQIEDSDIRAKTHGSLAILHTKLKEFDKALSYFNKALEIANEGASNTVKAQLKKSLGNLYIDLTQYDKAIEVLLQALKIAQSSPLEAQLVKIHQFLSLAYEKIGDTENALYHFKKYFELDKEFMNEEIALKTKALHIRYDLEELKKQKEIAELSDKLKEQFLANVSHEIRTPMNGVLGMAHLLGKTSPTREQQEYIDAIKISANNLMVIINDILDFSKINAGKIEFSETEFNIRDLIKGIVQILQVKADEKKIQIGCTLDYHIKDNLVGDPIRLNQILVNLMANAVKFTEKGKVTLDIKVLEVKDNVCKMRFRVTDSGIGIPDNKLQSIFESFEQAENNKRRYEGTGLGLTIVKQLVELQGGCITVKSRVNEGSEFTVDMHFKLGINRPKDIPAVEPVNIEPVDVSYVRVLVVEDNKVNQLLVKNMLKKFGFENFDTAENGKTALAKIRENDYDIILMDIQMPVMDGYEITKEIRTRMRPEIRQVPIIALTADASDKEKIKARESGMNDYVVKPYTPEELYGTMLKFIPEKTTVSKSVQRGDGSAVLQKNTPGMDLEFLDKFTGGDQELTIQLIEIFLRQLPDAVEKLNVLIPKKDWKETHAVAHKLKSSIAIFEFHELKKLITNIEEYARDGERLEDIPHLYAEFKEGSRVAVRDLEAELKKLQELVGKMH